MNIYDFDKTIYNGDSTLDFYFFCLRKRKRILLLVPIQFFALIFYICKIYDKTKFKEKFYIFLKFIPEVDLYIEEFWVKNIHKIKQWYLERKQSDDLIISASPSFLLEPVCNKLNVSLISSVVNKKTGKYIGKNCYGEEKVERLKLEVSYIEIENFYSDSISDSHLAKLATKAYLVKGDEIKDWM